MPLQSLAEWSNIFHNSSRHDEAFMYFVGRVPVRLGFCYAKTKDNLETAKHYYEVCKAKAMCDPELPQLPEGGAEQIDAFLGSPNNKMTAEQKEEMKDILTELNRIVFSITASAYKPFFPQKILYSPRIC